MNSITVGDILKSKNAKGYLRITNIAKVGEPNGNLVICYESVISKKESYKLVLDLPKFSNFCNSCGYKRVKNIFTKENYIEKE